MNDNERHALKLALWIDDDDEFLDVQESELGRVFESLKIFRLTSPNELEPAINYAAERGQFHVLLALHAKGTPDPTLLANVFTKVNFRIVISDLNIGRVSSSGLWILVSAATAKQSNLVLCTGNLEEPGARSAERLGAIVISKRTASTEIPPLLTNYLELPDHTEQYPQQHLLKSLQAELVKLQNERKQLKKRLFRLQKASSAPLDTREHKVQSRAEHASHGERIEILIQAHNHDLANASSLTMQILDHISADKSLIPPALLLNLERARITARHCDVLVSSLATVIQSHAKPRKGTCSIRQVLTDTCEILARKTGDRIRVVLSIDDHLRLCSIPADLLTRIILNLLLNAIEAIPDKGVISISAQPYKSKKNVLIDVTDNGRGIKKGDLEKVFNENFSTKGKQHGFGLSIAKQIVESYGGRIMIRSQRGKGTVVGLELRLA